MAEQKFWEDQLADIIEAGRAERAASSRRRAIRRAQAQAAAGRRPSTNRFIAYLKGLRTATGWPVNQRIMEIGVNASSLGSALRNMQRKPADFPAAFPTDPRILGPLLERCGRGDAQACAQARALLAGLTIDQVIPYSNALKSVWRRYRPKNRQNPYADLEEADCHANQNATWLPHLPLCIPKSNDPNGPIAQGRPYDSSSQRGICTKISRLACGTRPDMCTIRDEQCNTKRDGKVVGASSSGLFPFTWPQIPDPQGQQLGAQGYLQALQNIDRINQDKKERTERRRAERQQWNEENAAELQSQRDLLSRYMAARSASGSVSGSRNTGTSAGSGSGSRTNRPFDVGTLFTGGGGGSTSASGNPWDFPDLLGASKAPRGGGANIRATNRLPGGLRATVR